MSALQLSDSIAHGNDFIWVCVNYHRLKCIKAWLLREATKPKIQAVTVWIF